jgi:hypothetical protein
MTDLQIGDRVELKSCPGIHGTVTGFKRGSVHVRFDDFLNACSILRPTSLQLVTNQSNPGARPR